MNLRKLAPLGPCDGCGCIRRCRPVEADRYECLECTPAGDGAGELDELYNSDPDNTKRIVTDGGTHADQGRLAEYGATLDLDRLTSAERRAYVAVRINGVSARDHGLETGRSRRTIQNLLAKAERKLDGGSR